IDNNCSSTVDENYPDTDADGTADCLDTDDDNDGIVDALDNCPTVANPFQENNDSDFLGNACDADDDNDGDLDFSDCAPLDPGINSNAVELCDGVDNNCVDGIDEGYPDTNADGEADCIDADDDGDGILDASDNCVGVSNPSQINSDSDQLGDACDEDDDNDLDVDTIDCAPTDPSINSAATEVCDGIDNNCKNGVDEGFTNSDSDAFADCVDEDDDNDGDPDETDCDPTNGAVSNLGTEVCGNGIDDDCNPITNCFTAQQGETVTDATPTKGTEGAVAFYQYGTPNGASANTGLETVNKALEFLYEDPTDGKYYLMIILDSPGGGGGNVNMTISGAVGANLLVMDDPGEGNPQFNSASGSGTLKWNWVNCCTDGALIGPLTAPFCVTMTMNSYEGINGVITYSEGIAIPLGSPNVPVTLCANP
ncbi:MAG: putative metal-binding motif-containing protein, partial [Myxococcota bacterium]|nr:putative metal-binding motif-containing protein [Myxococcota bacterium]